MTYIPNSSNLFLTETNINKTLVVNEQCLVDTTNSEITITLPSGASKGDRCRVIDKGLSSTNKIIIMADMILGQSNTAIIDTDYGIATFTRVDDVYGWIYDNTGY